MTTTKTYQNANKIMWVEYWVNRVQHKFDDFQVEAQKVGDKWVCEIKLPYIRKTVTSRSSTEIGAMQRSSQKAARLIEKYIEDHPERSLPNRFKNGHWEVLYDEMGFVYKRMRVDYKQKQLAADEKMRNDSIKAVKKCIDRLRRIIGSSKDLFIHVLDESLFDSNKTENEKIMEMNEKLQKDYDTINVVFGSEKYDNKIVFVGTTFKKSELSQKGR